MEDREVYLRRQFRMAVLGTLGWMLIGAFGVVPLSIATIGIVVFLCLEIVIMDWDHNS